MKAKQVLAKIFAACGTALVCGSVLFMFVTAIVGSILSKQVRFDYLMLAELFPIVALGILLLFVSAIFSKQLVRLFGYLAAGVVILLAGAQLIAVATGLANGATPAGGWQSALVVGLIALFDLLIVAIGVVGVVFAARLFHKPAVDDALTAMESLEDSSGESKQEDEAKTDK